ncbi:MAG TPA: FprA family A-type flavoprotein [Sedimentisphaerales bacterium]|nr:FprA family A-type flavoprotein [Sedimentisphaerales bacterium]HRS11721.1 FprA family A-type flavoprotein [Sedimentisphaerales bacterium]HRV48384.1 FprA family A-type flavoprotein [Sedimentisphaerales bacterium]
MRQIRPNVFSIGAVDWDRRLFDELIPLPEGTTYNAYVVEGSDKVALLDTVDPTRNQTLMGNLVSLGLDKIDYIVAHHAEQDHSGSIPDILMLYPGVQVVTNAKCCSMLIDLLHIEEDRFLVVEDNATLPLGGKTLRFLNTPWVHWPETMCTYLEEDKVLFSCDFFGAHLAESNLFVADEPLVLEAAKRYYAEIMMPFRPAIRKNLERVEGLDIEVIAPSHGPVYDNPRLIVDAYKDWVSDDVKNEVVLAYVSMHESTQKMAEHLTAALIERGITVRPFNLTVTDLGKLAIALVDAATVVLGSPTVLTGAHPKAAYAALVANALRPKTRFASIIGSFGWAGKMTEQLAGLISNLKVELIPPVVAKGHPKDEDFLALDQLASEIFRRHEAIGIVK